MGPTFEEISRAVSKGVDATADLVLANIPAPAPPVKHRDDFDPYVALGSTWVKSPYKGGSKYRGQSLDSWNARTIVASQDQTNIQHRMTMFWCDYFGISGRSTDHRTMYKQLRLFQDLGTGNFRTMIERITVEPRMLHFLDGMVNNKKNPNENYGRELMELFTIGKGLLVGDGDYTTYTEQDVASLSRSLTGWRNRDYLYSDYNIPVESYFDSSNHDTGDKLLSHRFGNRVIRNAGADEYKVVIDILINQRETAKNFCRKLYRYFVYYDITDEVEREVISPLADTMIANNHEIKPVLKQLFTSAHFYDTELMGGMIKNPQEYLCSIIRPFREYEHDDRLEDLLVNYQLGGLYAGIMSKLNLIMLEAPTVSGWKAYYDAPQYYRHWISPSLMQSRYEIAREFVTGNFHVNNRILEFNLYDFLETFPERNDINTLISQILLVFLPRELSSEKKSLMKELIMEGNADKGWQFELRDYLANRGNRSYYIPMEKRLNRFFAAVFSLPEFQLQ